MQVKISKTLEGLIARTAFQTTKAGIRHSLKDFLTLELLREEGSLAYQLLSARLQDWELHQVRQRIERAVLAVEPTERSDTQQHTDESETFYRNFTDELRSTVTAARSISTGHALQFIASDPATATAQVLEAFGINAEIIAADMQKFVVGEDFRTEIQVRMLDFDTDDRQADDTNRLLEKFGVDLTRQAREGLLDPVVGREAEIERVVQILSRRKKNNPILIGEAGVGKSAVVEGLALRIAAGEVPYTIADKRVFSLDISSLVAGTKFRGEFEERMQQLLDELRKAQNTIIFIDEIHTIVGAGSTQGSLDTANILKPALARGELQTIGATTLNEYRENIERDSALERRFQKVLIEPTTPEQTLRILQNIAPHYERHHNVRYTDEALRACVTLSERYITDRYFPDKAIDVLDEAGSRIHLLSAQEPAELREMETALCQVQRERREAIDGAVYEKAASARLRELALRSKLGDERAEWRRTLEANPMEITEAHIRQVITAMTGIPADRISESEMSRLHALRDHLSGRVVGQQEAVERISRTIC
ncbi:MAG: ATP-dependent Clp protease ATP-binding subunit, partial [Alistipes sp.]|nr:ATP-dependent Clp protease ATP-binding subunit [Alistipes sp.]